MMMTTRRGRGERGAAAIEFALLLPVLIMLVFGIIEFGRAYNATITLSHAAREGARELAVSGNYGDAVDVAEAAAATSLDAGSLSFSGGPGNCSAGSTVELTVEYVFSYNIPLIPSPDINLSSTGVMRCGG